MTAEQARREDEEYFNAEPIEPFCEFCGDTSIPLYTFYGHRVCKDCIEDVLDIWGVDELIQEIAEEPHKDRLEEKALLADFILENLEVFYG